jgi:hypothetical protein
MEVPVAADATKKESKPFQNADHGVIGGRALD